MRTGCDHLAEAQLSFDPVNCHAWIDALLPEPGPAQELCGTHATNLKVPQGWECEDRRQLAFAPSPSAVEPEVAVEPEPEEEPTRVSEPKPARAKAKSKPKPSLLSRALKTTGPQRSALSEELGAPSSTDTSTTDSSSTDSSSTGTSSTN